ncbi:MAG TPA: PQQ-binding-like beta-propeller repeat protein [Bryobacteraceae bacterium]|nr:PQQ-binding-like beta-propeller repeat protein [Bryobacteraceae bacterium]
MLRSRPALWLAIILFPPLGLILLWMRRDYRVLGKLTATVAVLAIAVVELFYVYGMRVIWDGGVTRIMGVSFRERQRHDAAIEENRAKQKQEPEPPAPEPASVAVKVPTTAVKVIPVAYWTDFRGPHRDGVYAQSEINTQWPLPMLWKQPIGGGYASFTFGEGRAYTIEQRRDKETIAAYDPQTGREIWTFAYPASFDEVLGGPGPRATPVYHEGLLYSLGANGDFYCLNAKTGKSKWSKNILTDNGASNIHWAMSGSPLIVDEKVIVTPGGSGKSIVAYNKLTGDPIWQSLSDEVAYTSPILATLGGRRQLVWISAQRAVGIAPEDGKLLWEYPFPAQMGMNCSQPVLIDDTHVLLSSSQGPGAALLEITDAGVKEIWKNIRLKNKFNSSVLYQGYVYGLDEQILACIDPKTGDVKWKGGRYGYGQILLAGAHIIVLTEDGEVVLVRATPEAHQEIARFKAIEGRTWNIPAIDNGLLLVRNASEMACFRIGRNIQ